MKRVLCFVLAMMMILGLGSCSAEDEDFGYVQITGEEAVSFWGNIIVLRYNYR